MTIVSGIGTRVNTRLLNEQYKQQATALACSVAHSHDLGADERTPVRFRLDVALYIGDAARVGRKVSYGELTARFGNPPEGWGAILAAIASGLRNVAPPCCQCWSLRSIQACRP